MHGPLHFTFPSTASCGRRTIRFDFDIATDRPYRFSVECPIELGMGDVYIKISSHLNDEGELEVEQRLVNRTRGEVSFRCHLSAPNSASDAHPSAAIRPGRRRANLPLAGWRRVGGPHADDSRRRNRRREADPELRLRGRTVNPQPHATRRLAARRDASSQARPAGSLPLQPGRRELPNTPRLAGQAIWRPQACGIVQQARGLPVRIQAAFRLILRELLHGGFGPVSAAATNCPPRPELRGRAARARVDLAWGAPRMA